MTDQSLQFPRFYVTAPAPCPYLPGRQERKVFTELRGEEAGPLNDALSRVGFRRSQSVAYRPACESCSACISVRVIAEEFTLSRNMRRVSDRNEDIVVQITDPIATREQYRLLKSYLSNRHPSGGMADMDFQEYADMVEHSPVTTRLFEYRLPGANGQPGQLIACCLSDILSDGLSMVYSFFDPTQTRRSLGTYIILQHIAEACARHQRYVYLGYWIEGSSKMDYKARFQPMERLGANGWSRFVLDKKP
ncbi:MAG: arginyltransferase [Pseudomonadota bacterium]